MQIASLKCQLFVLVVVADQLIKVVRGSQLLVREELVLVLVEPVVPVVAALVLIMELSMVLLQQQTLEAVEVAPVVELVLMHKLVELVAQES